MKKYKKLIVHPNVSVLVILIHNNDDTRVNYIRPQIENLIQNISEKYTIETSEVSYQSSITPHSDTMSFRRDFIYQMLELEWKRYRHIRERYLRSVVNFFLSSAKKYLMRRNEKLKNWKVSSFIEVAVTDKHIRAWNIFLDSDADLLICLEDDAVFTDYTHNRLTSLLALIGEKYLREPAYFDLAGGCLLDDLKVSLLELSKDNNYRYYKKPISNTACAYLITKSLAKEFHNIITNKTWLKLIGIDWMINKLFIEIAKKQKNIFCLHCDPSIFIHGSVNKYYKPWSRSSHNKN